MFEIKKHLPVVGAMAFALGMGVMGSASAQTAGAANFNQIEQAAQVADICAAKLTSADEEKVATAAWRAVPEVAVGDFLTNMYSVRGETRVMVYSIPPFCKDGKAGQALSNYKSMM